MLVTGTVQRKCGESDNFDAGDWKSPNENLESQNIEHKLHLNRLGCEIVRFMRNKLEKGLKPTKPNVQQNPSRWYFVTFNTIQQCQAPKKGFNMGALCNCAICMCAPSETFFWPGTWNDLWTHATMLPWWLDLPLTAAFLTDYSTLGREICHLLHSLQIYFLQLVQITSAYGPNWIPCCIFFIFVTLIFVMKYWQIQISKAENKSQLSWAIY